MRRFISILIIVLIFVGVILLGAWFFARRTAQKEGRTPPTFKEFVSRDVGTRPGTQTPGDLSSVFVDDTLTTATPGNTAAGTSGTIASTFTTTTSTPAQNNTPNNNTNPNAPGTGASGGTTTTSTTVIIDPTTLPPATVPPIIPGPECSDADLNIRFTPSELARLQVLQNRFYAISQTLHTDGDVATETGNHDNFKVKVDKFTALYNSCISYSAAIPATSQYAKRIPTPFWHADQNLGADAELFIGVVPPPTINGPIFGIFGSSSGPNNPYDGDIGGRGTWNGSVNGVNPIMPNNTALGLRSLERSLRLNFW